jgi:hypothetical protein
MRAILAAPLLLAMLGASAHAGEAHIRIEEPTGLDRREWPVELGLPFRKGEVRDPGDLRVIAPSGENLPLQAGVLTRWDDGSLRWAHILFFADLKAQKTEIWRLAWNTALPRASAESPIEIRQLPGGLSVNTGPLQARIEGPGRSLFRSLVVDGVEFMGPGGGGIFRLADTTGTVYESMLREAGDVRVEEEGPLRTIVRLQGRHTSENGRTLLDYTARLIFYSGKRWCEIEYAFTNREEPERACLHEISVRIPLKLGVPFRGTTSEYKIDKFWEFDRRFRIYSGKDDLFGVFSGAKMYTDDGTEIAGTGYESEARARFWADASDGDHGLTVSIRDMSNNYPKGIWAGPGGVTLEMYPSTEPSPLAFHQGWRKRHRMLLYFHRGSAREAGSRELSFCWQEPVIPWTEQFVESGVLGPLLPYKPAKYPYIERSLRDAFIAYEGGLGRGMIDDGDTRGTGIGERADFWSNNAYDTPWAAFLMFFRTGERRYWTRAVTAARHMMDIDIVHYSTRNATEIGGVRIHGPGHVQYGSEAIAGSSVAPNHEWVEGLLAAYHATGDRDYLEAARGVADHILRAIDAGWVLPPYNAKWNGARNWRRPLPGRGEADSCRHARSADGQRFIPDLDRSL